MSGYVYGASRKAIPGGECRRQLVERRNLQLREQAARQRALAWHRDVPRSCTCEWTLAAGAAFVVTGPDAACPWHTARPQPPAAVDPAEAAGRRAVLDGAA